MSTILEELQKILTNLKKTPNRNYSISTIERKLITIKDLKQQFYDLIDGDAEQLPISLELMNLIKYTEK